MVKYIRLKFKTDKSPEIIIYSKGRFKEFSITQKNSLNSTIKNELVSNNNKILEAIEVLTISIDHYLFSYNKYDGFTYGVFLSIIDSIINELENLDNAILSEISIGVFHLKSFDLQQVIKYLNRFFIHNYIKIVTDMNQNKGVNYSYAFSKINIKLNSHEIK